MYIDLHPRFRWTSVQLGCLRGMYLPYVIGLVLCVLSNAAGSQQTSDEWDSLNIMTLIEPLVKIRPIVQMVRKEIDRSQFDRNELLDELDYDAQRIIAFVRDQISFEAYSGLLRGPDGTLLSGAGNAMDQAVFLAAMLRDAGYEARVVEGEISAGEAAHLVNRMRDRRGVRSPFKDDSEVVRLANQMNGHRPVVENSNRPESETIDKALDKVRRVAGTIVTEIRDSDLNLGSMVVTWDDIVSESQHYHWVQYRDSASGGWLDIHPAFEYEFTPSAVELKFFSTEIPQDRAHKIRISAFISQRIGGRYLEKPVMAPWERPTANLSGVTIKYANLPNGFAQQAEEKDDFDAAASQLRETISASRLYFPMLNDQLAPDSDAFDLNGNIVPSDAANSYMAGLFQELGANVESATGALLGDEEVDGDVMSLVDHWIQVELIAPDGEIRDYKRYLVTRDHDQETRSLALTREVSILVEPGRPSLAKYLDNMLALLVAASHTIEMLAQEDTKIEPGEIEELTAFASGAHNWDYDIGISGLTDNLEAVSVYRPYAGVVASYRSLIGKTTNPTVPDGFDILTDFHYVWSEDNGRNEQLSINPEKTVQLGVGQTMLESLARIPGASPESNAFLSWDEVAPDNTVFKIDKNTLSDWPAEVSGNAYLSRDIEQGSVAIVQSGSPQRDLPATWWRVNTNTAETIGMNAGGWGGVSFLPFAQISLDYKIILSRATHMVGPTKTSGIILKCNMIIVGVQATGLQMSQAGGQLGPASNGLGALLGVLGATTSSVAAALQTPAGYEAFMKRCIMRNLWRPL